METLQSPNPHCFQIEGRGIDSGSPKSVVCGDMRPFADALKKLRRRARMSQDELGAKAGVNGQTISNIETGTVTTPAHDTYRRIASALGLTVADLDAEWDAPEAEMVVVKIPREVADGLRARIEREFPSEGVTLEAWLARQANVQETTKHPLPTRAAAKRLPTPDPRTNGGRRKGR